MTIKLPDRFETILKRAEKYRAETLRLIDEFSDWFKDNKTEFFPEYTDHGIEHIQSVLDTADEIISKDSWNILSPEDIYVLVSSVLLHDCAMHISKDGLWELISNNRFNGVLFGFDPEDEWKTRWNNFSSDIDKFEESDWVVFYGEYKPVSLPNISDSAIDDHQKILIGDFVRKYHACIAQVISTYGIPIANDVYEIFNNDFTPLNQLAGFVARSHNHSLRSAKDKIRRHHRDREHLNVHVAYLMGVLRISDYMQFTIKRTPKILFKSKGFCSPISIAEWKKHLAILHTHNSDDDDELLFVEAYPDDAKTLVGINKLLKAFQKELDDFWAVTGEVYSRIPNLSSLGIKYRRVKSTTDNPHEYAKDNHKNYYPEILEIKSDNKKLFPLLVKPLYGDTPQIGVRELMQNALDACNERYSIEIDGTVNKEEIPYSVSLTIDLDNEYLIIKDEGIGMDVDVIKNYFLRIGASYRYSEIWKSYHMNKELVHVPRTGKFGVGMLAGFLIGDKISVKSKRAGDHDIKGLKFTYKVDSSEIELNYVSLNDTGTVIKVFSDKERLNKILHGLKTNPSRLIYQDHYSEESSWWYYLDSPKIKTTVIENDDTKELNIDYVIKKSDLLLDWNSMDSTSLQDFYWRRNINRPHVFCNGVIIKELKSPSICIDAGIDKVRISDLEVCVFDNKGEFPLNLTRNALLTEDFFEHEKLFDSVAEIYFLNIKDIIQGYEYSRNNIIEILKKYPINDCRLTPVVFCKNKVFPITGPELIKIDEYIFVDFLFSNQNRGMIYHNSAFSLLDCMNYCCMNNMEKSSATLEYALERFILNAEYKHKWTDGEYSSSFENLPINSYGWLFVKKYDFDKFSEHEKKRYEEAGVVIKHVNKKWLALSASSTKEDIPILGLDIISEKNLNSFIFAIIKIESVTTSKFSELWKKHIN